MKKKTMSNNKIMNVKKINVYLFNQKQTIFRVFLSTLNKTLNSAQKTFVLKIFQIGFIFVFIKQKKKAFFSLIKTHKLRGGRKA